jgi:hypothetical protein
MEGSGHAPLSGIHGLLFSPRARGEGQSELLMEMITTRFGQINADLRSKLIAANPKQLSAWARNFVDATTLDEVFDSK